MTSLPTILDRFSDSVERHPDSTAVHLVGAQESVDLSYGELFDVACRAAAGLAHVGLGRGDRLLVALPNGRELLGLYLGALASGVIPVILAEPRPGADSSVLGRRLELLLGDTGARCLLVPDQAVSRMPPELERKAIGAGQLLARNGPGISLRAEPEAVAHLQATSGTTGSPKLAVLRHRNISVNVKAIGDAIGQRAGDRVVSWLPLYHDMGLICISCILYWQRPLVLTDSANFVRNPIRFWLRMITEFEGTISPAPTSAYQICARLGRRRRFEGLDLTAWRVAFCGAEPVYRRTLDDFFAVFAPAGLSAATLLPVYGLAEATLAVSIPSVEEMPTSEVIDLGRLETEGIAEPAGDGCRRRRAVVALGPALSGHRLEISDERGRAMGERRVGEIRVAGPSVVDGYWGGEGLKDDAGFVSTGDLGYVAGGELFFTERKKDIIILHGRNLIPTEIERVAEAELATGIHLGVAAVGLPNEELGTEELHLVIESRRVPPANARELEDRLRGTLSEVCDVAGFFIHWVRKGEIPKTTSGKMQRQRCREVILRERGPARQAQAVAHIGPSSAGQTGSTTR